MQQFTLPDLHSMCPFKVATNPHYDTVAAESRAWVNSFKLFSDEKRAQLIANKNELLVAHGHPFTSPERLRICCDVVNILFFVDEISDLQDGKGAISTGMTFLNVLNDPSWDDGSGLAQMTREFTTRLYKYAKPNCRRRFYKACTDYVDAVGKEADDRVQGKVLDPVSFEKLRRDTSGSYTCFDLIELALDIDLPDEVFEHPTFKNIRDWGCDLIWWGNDLYSYDLEQSRGLEGSNVLRVLVEANNCTLQEAVDRSKVLFGDLMSRFIAERKKLPSWGPDLDRDVSLYVDTLCYWIVGNLHWCLETPRYFGTSREYVRRTRIVKLRPRKAEAKSDGNALCGGSTGDPSWLPFSVHPTQASMLYLVISMLLLAYVYNIPKFELAL